MEKLLIFAAGYSYPLYVISRDRAIQYMTVSNPGNPFEKMEQPVMSDVYTCVCYDDYKTKTSMVYDSNNIDGQLTGDGLIRFWMSRPANVVIINVTQITHVVSIDILPTEYFAMSEEDWKKCLPPVK